MNGNHPVVHGTLAGVDSGGYHYSDPYEELAAEIIAQAVKDYVNIIKGLWLGTWKTPKEKREMLLEKIELEAFFHSGWYEMLTDIDPDGLIIRCKTLAKQKAKETIMAANKRKVAKEKKEKEKTTEQGGTSK